MARLPIIHVPDDVLRKTAQPVTTVTSEIRQLLDDMAETMYDAPGIGLAANQIGSLERLIVMDCGDDDAPELWQMINPEIIWESEEQSKLEEGCLSIPGHNAEVTRPASVRARYMNIEGNICEMEADGLLAACIQHEIDHLNGVLFIDHLSRLKKSMIWKKVLKAAQT
ncbi:MAG: peptide deformylase [Candidatus Puniceispirillaceae bacterium]